SSCLRRGAEAVAPPAPALRSQRATNELDRVPMPELGSEGYFYRHGHRGLLAGQPPSRTAHGTTTQDTYGEPRRSARPARGEAALPAGTPGVRSGPGADGARVPAGQREAMLELMLFHKYRQEVLEETCPPPAPMESLSTTHRDYRAEGFQPAPLPPTQPHDCYAEQPRSYWLEQARSVPGVTSICSSTDTPFRRSAAFSTPVTERLGQPL
ncbi:SPAG8 protein, partial [Nothoprocta pentlandii]|nr:SPAG8 protein [Nothoprocta pentlandii]